MTLNPAQQNAVESTAALRVVLAGPGSGKTRTMVEAIKEAALQRGKPFVVDSPRIRIAIMTFTNAGANELRQRLTVPDREHSLGTHLSHCGTLHSYCFKLIQRFGGFLGYIPGKVGILPDSERIPRLLQCRDKLGYKISQKAILDCGTDAEGDNPGAKPSIVWAEYEFLLKRNNLVDYDGILRIGLELLKDHAAHLASVQLDYLFVDEYQDSALIDQLIYEAIPAANKMYVGDSDQSIFAFRGANPMGFVHLARAVFDNSITDAEGFKLEVNYRSDMDICTVANALIRHNVERVEKEIVPVSTELGAVTVNQYENVGQELTALGAAISGRNLGSSKLGQSETIAILFRMNHDVVVCRDYLQAMGVPVQRWKSTHAQPADWERAMLLLALAGSPENEILAERYLRLDNSAAQVKQWVLQSRSGLTPLGSRMIPVVAASLHKAPRYLAENGVSESTIHLIKQRVELLGPDADLSDLIHDLHSKEETKECDTAGVYIGTIHSAKGREFDVVFLPAFEQGVIPNAATLRLLDPAEISVLERDPLVHNPLRVALEEERRLAFVAVTRARHELYISHSEHRRGQYGQQVGTGQPSQFLREMGL